MFKVGFSYFQGRFLLTDFYPWELTGMSIGVYAAAGVGMLLLGLDKVGVYCSWEMMGPPSPALGRSWGKVLLCHKGLGGVFCVSGPGVCQPKALGRSTSWSTFFWRNWPSLSHSWLDSPVVLLCQVTLQPSFLVFSSPSFPRVVPHLVCVLFPHPHSPSSILLPSLPLFVFCPSHQ